MTIEVVMPAMEMDQDTARLVRWLKSEGEFVEKGQPLMEIETDKVTVEIEAPGSGVLSDVRVYPGTDVPVGQVVALLRDELAEPLPPFERASAPPPLGASPVARRIAAPHFDVGLINPPEVGILAVGRARELPAFVAGQVVPRRMLDLTLSADHRALDGATAASFLKRLEALMLEPAAHLRDKAPGSSGETRR